MNASLTVGYHNHRAARLIHERWLSAPARRRFSFTSGELSRRQLVATDHCLKVTSFSLAPTRTVIATLRRVGQANAPSMLWQTCRLPPPLALSLFISSGYDSSATANVESVALIR
jgi:hypothetical protein